MGRKLTSSIDLCPAQQWMSQPKIFKVAEHSFLVPMRYSSLFSNHWQLGSQNWQDASSTIYILICFIGLGTITMATQLVVNQYLIMGLIYFQTIQSLDFVHHLSLESSEKYWPNDTGLVKF